MRASRTRNSGDINTLKRCARARVWLLLLPLPLAVSLVALVGLAARHIVDTPSLSSPRDQHLQSPAAAAWPQRPGRSEDADARPEAAPRQAPSEASSTQRTDEARSPSPPSTGSSAPDSQRSHSAPAPEPVAPSYEVALRASEPPPAAASAPRLAPAALIPLVPAPEPSAPPPISSARIAEPRRAPRPVGQVRAVRFDAAYYYGRGLSARELASELTESWARQGVNLVYYYAYNRVYGARYRTSYAGNIMEDYGRQDLLRHVVREAHRRDIKVIAWLHGVQHKHMWEAHPDWREKNADGTDYKPDGDSYLLCVRNAEVTQWWLGLLDELLTSYPELDGIDLAEFQLDVWGDNACHCEHCRRQFAQAHPTAATPSETWRQFRAQGLTQLLLASSRLAHGYGKEVHLTTVLTARADGTLMSSAQVRDAIGFDLEAVLSSPDRPDVLQAELIWQQWAAVYNDPVVFTPEWTAAAVRQARDMVRGRAGLIAHVEVTDFGTGRLDGPRLTRTIASAVQAGPAGIDVYDAHLLAEMEGSRPYLRTAWLAPGH